MSTQMIGFSIGGIGKRFLVAPPSMSTLPDAYAIAITLLNSHHSLACESRPLRALQHAALAAIQRHRLARWYQSRALLHLRVLGSHLLVYVVHLPFLDHVADGADFSLLSYAKTSSRATYSPRSPSSHGCAGSGRTMVSTPLPQPSKSFLYSEKLFPHSSRECFPSVLATYTPKSSRSI